MTDEAVTAEPSAPAAPPAAPETVDTPPAELKSHMDAKPEPKVEKPSTRDAIRKATEAVEAREKAEAKEPPDKAPPKPAEAKTPPKADDKADPKAKPDDKPSQERGEHGHFAAKEKPEEPKPKADDDERSPPKRWDARAQATWKSIEGDEHTEVRREIHRSFREMEQGLAKYGPVAKRYHDVYMQYDQMARQSNVDPKKVLDEYVRLDRMINNPKTLVQAIEQILNGRGVTLQQFAQHVTGQPGDPNKPGNPGRSASEIATAQQIAKLEQRLSASEQASQRSQAQGLATQVAEWGKDKAHFERLSPRIAQIIRDDRLTLPDAYAKALGEAEQFAAVFNNSDSRLSPSSPATAKSSAELDAQTVKGSRSITGAPSAGSDPAAHKPSSSIKEAIRRAQARVA